MKVKCSLHNHSSMSDGAMSPGEFLHIMKDRGFNVIAITDHNQWTLPHELQIPDNIIFINGVEWTFRYHIIKLELPTNKSIRTFSWKDRLDLARVDWLAHPGLAGLSHSKILELIRNYKLDGVEKCNRNFHQYDGTIPGVIEYGVDDVHSERMIGWNWIEMEVDSFDKETILEKLKKGEFNITRRKGVKAYPYLYGG